MTKLHFLKLIVFVALLSSITFPNLTPVLAEGFQQTTRSDVSWLDGQPTNWNRRMDGLPRPTKSASAVEIRNGCPNLVRHPDSAAERALVRAGWLLYGPVQSFEHTRVVTAMSGVDGMCRPLGYQAFVYWEGRYAGTLSPVAMNSRTDGAMTNFRLVSPTRILAEFARFNESDPLCCPTRTSHVTFEVNRDDMALVTPVDINTGPVGAPAEWSDSKNAQSDAVAQLFGRRWMLTEMDGKAVNTTKAYIEFDRAAKRFSGNGGCNLIGGEFAIAGTNLKLSRGFSTQMACIDHEVERIERDLLKRLEQTSRFEIHEDILRLYAGGAATLTFQAYKTEAGGAAEEGRVIGTVTYLQRMALTPNAVIEVKLVDVSNADSEPITIAEQVIKPAGRRVPFDFELRYDPHRIDPRHSYSIQARILDNNNTLFISTKPYPVITGGHPNEVHLVLVPR